MGKKKSGKKKSGKKKGKKGAKEDEAPDPFAGLTLDQVCVKRPLYLLPPSLGNKLLSCWE